MARSLCGHFGEFGRLKRNSRRGLGRCLRHDQILGGSGWYLLPVVTTRVPLGGRRPRKGYMWDMWVATVATAVSKLQAEVEGL